MMFVLTGDISIWQLEKENSTYAIGDGRELRKNFVANKLEAPTTNGYDKLALVRSLGENTKS